MRAVLTTVAALAAVLAVSACGSSSYRTAFTSSSNVGQLSVPTPAGFKSRTWRDGVVISDRSGKVLIPVEEDRGGQGGVAGFPNQDELVVLEDGPSHGPKPPAALKLPLTLHDLGQLSDGLTEWDGGGSVGGGLYVVKVWLGPKAPSADRSAILSALQNIKLR